MKNKKYVLLSFALFPIQALAGSTTCTKDKLERRVEVTPIDVASKTPCEVRYFKEAGDEGRVLWSAKNKNDYCETKSAEFIQKLQSFGWNCSGTTAPAASTEKKD